MGIETRAAREGLWAETYARAERLLPDHLKDLAFGLRVRPKWIEGTDRFWYQHRTREGEEIVLVDATAGTREMVSEPPETAPAPAMGELPSPDKRWTMLVRGDNLVVRDTASGEERQLTEDGEAHQF